MGIMVEIDPETLDKAMVGELLETRKHLLEDYVKGTTGVFDFDPAEDRRQIGELIKAVERVIDWFSVPGAYTFDELPEVDA